MRVCVEGICACVRVCACVFSPAPSVLGSTFCMADHQEEDCPFRSASLPTRVGSPNVRVARRSRGQLLKSHKASWI